MSDEKLTSEVELGENKVEKSLSSMKAYVRAYTDGHEPGDRTIAFYASMLAKLAGTYPGLRLGGALVVLAFKAAYYVVLAGILGTLGYWALDRAVPIVITDREAVSHEVHAGDQLLIRTTRQRLRDCELTPDSYLVDGIGRKHEYISPEPRRYGPPDEKPVVTTDGPYIPRYAAPGPSSWFATWQYDCNPLQRFTRLSIPVYAKRIDFVILPPRDPVAGQAAPDGPTDYRAPPAGAPRPLFPPTNVAPAPGGAPASGAPRGAVRLPLFGWAP